MAVYSGISDKIQIIKEATWGSGTGTDKVFGINSLGKFSSDTNSDVLPDIDGSALNKCIYDKVITTNFEYSGVLVDARFFFEAMFGSLTDAGAGSYTLAVTPSQPSYAFRMSLDDGTNSIVKGAMMSTCNLTLAKEDVVRLKSTWVAKSVGEDATAVGSGSVTSLQPYSFLGGYLTIGSFDCNLDNLEISMDRGLVPRRGIEQTGANTQRLPTSITGKKLKITFSGTNVADKQLLRDVLGGATLTDFRTDATITLNLSNPAGKTVTTAITGRITASSKEVNPESEVALMDFSGLGYGINMSGTYTV